MAEGKTWLSDNGRTRLDVPAHCCAPVLVPASTVEEVIHNVNFQLELIPASLATRTSTWKVSYTDSMPSWISWGSKIEPKPPTTRLDDLGRNLAHIQAESDDVMKRLHAQFRSLPPQYQAASEIVAVVTITLGGRFIYARHLRRIPNADWVNPSMLKRKRWIKGYVTRCLPAPSVLSRRV